MQRINQLFQQLLKDIQVEMNDEFDRNYKATYSAIDNELRFGKNKLAISYWILNPALTFMYWKKPSTAVQKCQKIQNRFGL